jgi:hypothetical protein
MESKGLLALTILGIIGMIISIVGLFILQTNDELLLWSFIGFSLLGCGALVIDAKISEKELKNK